MSSDDQIQHQPDVSTQKRSDDQIDTPILPRIEGGESLGADMATKEDLDELYAKVMNGEWDDVIKMYKEKKQNFQTAKITNSKTALHIAISNSRADVVEKLLDNIDAVKIQEMTDDRKENPLHLAASLGQFETCKLLVKMDPGLIWAKNVEGETPLFLAVLHGKTEAFYALHPRCPISGRDIKAHCKRNDGNHILHASIRGEYFELAYQIINWYPELINEVNKDGQTALHFLAENPSAFRSGCYLGPVDDFIYSFTWARTWKEIINSKNVDRLPVKNASERQETSNRDPIQDEMSQYSCELCDHGHIIINGAKTEPQMGSGDSTPQEGNERPQYPSNYYVFLHFLQFAIGLFLYVISLGYFQVRKIKAMKQKHKLTYQIMKKLVHNTELWVYGGTGSRPDTKGGKESISLRSIALSLRSIAPHYHLIEDQDDIRQDVSASTSNTPRPDGFEDGKKRTEMMEPNRKLNELVQKIIQGNEVFVEAEEIRLKVYRFKMQKDSIKDDKYVSPILIAAKMGIVEIVKEVLNNYPLAHYDEDSNKKNVLMLAAENGQVHVVDLLRKKYSGEHIIYQKVDNKGDTVIHLAATFGKNRPWRISSAAIQMQWDIKWYNICFHGLIA